MSCLIPPLYMGLESGQKMEKDHYLKLSELDY